MAPRKAVKQDRAPEDRPALEMIPRSVSVIVPTYREAENIAELVGRLRVVAAQHGLEIELLIVDDNSDDGIAEIVSGLGVDGWVRLVVRDARRSLSGAVVTGLGLARHETLVVMDADLSHPPEAIPRLLETLAQPGVDFVFGSRYVAGGTIDERWTLVRRVNSLVARWLARPLVPVRDPTSGFFALRREQFLGADELSPIGYKIGLELVVKCRCTGVREVPIHFSERRRGMSKLDLRERLRYLQHLKRLMSYRFGRASRRAGGGRRLVA